MRLGMHHPGHAERLGDAFRRDVVMRRPDAAGGEKVIELGAQLVDRRDDRRLDIGNDPRFAQGHADLVQALRYVGQIRVLGPAREDLVADDKDRGGDDLFAGRIGPARGGVVLRVGGAHIRLPMFFFPSASKPQTRHRRNGRGRAAVLAPVARTGYDAP